MVARRTPRRVLVIAEFALALTLLACGGLALKSFWNLTRIDLGIRTDHVLSFLLPVPEQRLKDPTKFDPITGKCWKDSDRARRPQRRCA